LLEAFVSNGMVISSQSFVKDQKQECLPDEALAKAGSETIRFTHRSFSESGKE
jgi:hypothetical protein